MIRRQFEGIDGASDLAMLASPTAEELDALRRAVAVMTAGEKASAAELTDPQVQRIAEDARVDPAVFAIFINGYALHRKRVSRPA
ncbi:MAG: hypothetical protein KBE04_06380 [Phycisphaerae bacterium]|nr:hypothetical protein [Phycisphaerae bacterium]